jgi:hypothetical protein
MCIFFDFGCKRMTGEYYGLRDEPMMCSRGVRLGGMWFGDNHGLMYTTAKLYTALETIGLNPRVSSSCRDLSDEIDTEIFVSSRLGMFREQPELAQRIAQFAYELDAAVKEEDRVVQGPHYASIYDTYLLKGSSGKVAKVHVRKNDGKKHPENRVLDQILASF